MGIPNYSVLKGDPVGPGKVSGKNPHYRFALRTASGDQIQVDVNVESTDGSEIRYQIVNNFTPGDTAGLEKLPLGQTGIEQDEYQSLRLDYVQEKNPDGTPMVDPDQMQNLDIKDNRLHNAVSDLLNKALEDPNGLIYAFGSFFADDDGEEGIHDIHMNQGNPPGKFANDNGEWQDGAIFIQLPQQQAQWTALFIAFRTQSF